jgi:hypothetical protein
MKRIILSMFVFMFLVVNSCNVFAKGNRESEWYQNAVTVGYSPWGYCAGYTLKLSEKQALSLTASYFGWSFGMPQSSLLYAGIITGSYEAGASVIGIGGSYDIFLQPQALSGFYVGPDIGLLLFSATQSDLLTTVNVTTFSVTGRWEKTTSTSILIRIGGKLGYRWIFDGGFVADLNLSPALLIGTPPAGTYAQSGVLVGLGAGVGLAF